MSLEESINRLITVIESRWPVASQASPPKDPGLAFRKVSPKAAPAPKVEPPKYDDVRLAILDLAEKKGMPAALLVLKKFDVTHAKSLKPEQYAEALAACQAA